MIVRWNIFYNENTTPSKDKVYTPYDTIYTNDDDLVLYMSKKLKNDTKGTADPF